MNTLNNISNNVSQSITASLTQNIQQTIFHTLLSLSPIWLIIIGILLLIFAGAIKNITLIIAIILIIIGVSLMFGLKWI